MHAEHNYIIASFYAVNKRTLYMYTTLYCRVLPTYCFEGLKISGPFSQSSSHIYCVSAETTHSMWANPRAESGYSWSTQFCTKLTSMLGKSPEVHNYCI